MKNQFDGIQILETEELEETLNNLVLPGSVGEKLSPKKLSDLSKLLQKVQHKTQVCRHPVQHPSDCSFHLVFFFNN